MPDDEQYLILIRHGQSQPVEGVDAQRWGLSAEGLEQSQALASRLGPYAPSIVFSSYERKAVQTAEVVARGLDVPHVLWPGLHEHMRTAVPYFDRETFLALVRRFFARPGELVFGQESAEQALTRFQTALYDLMDAYPRRTVAVVSHGTVLTLLLAPLVGEDPYTFWERLGMPAYAVLTRPALEVAEMVEKL